MILKEEIANWRVLVVDDHVDSREVAALTLGLQGAQVVGAANGEDALNLLDGWRPTFILLDLSMPVMDGWALLHHLRLNENTASIPVIALTAHAMTGDRDHALEAGFDHYITKPFSPISFVDDLLADRKSTRLNSSHQLSS